MNSKKIKYLRGFFAFFCIFVILLVGNYIWQNYYVKQPLDTILQSTNGVQKVIVANNGKLNQTIEISVVLDKLPNFYKAYEDINKKIIASIGNKAYKLNIADNRTDELEQLYYDINPNLQEAIVNGDFPEQIQKINLICKDKNVESKIYLDSSYIYLQLTKGDNSLYELIPRQLNKTGGNANV